LLFCSALASAQPVAHIEVAGLYSMPEDELLDLLDIRRGKTLDKAGIGNGIKRAFLKGIFDDIVVEENEEGVRVTVKEKAVIASITVQGNEHFTERFIKRRFGINEGKRLTHSRLKKAVESLETALRKNGFPGSKAAYRIISKKDNRIEIAIDVIEGAPELIKKITIAGSKDVADVVYSYLGLSVGDILDRTEMERLSEKVSQYYRKAGHVGTALSYSYENGALDIKPDAGRMLTVSFEGNSALSPKELMQEVTFHETNEFSEDMLEETTSKITALYRRNGYPFAQVAPVISSPEDGTENAINLKIFVFEGERHSVDSIEIIGMPESLTVSQENLKRIIALSAGGLYNPDLLESDRETIAEFYHALGYLYADIQEPEVIIGENKAAIKFYVKEGPQVKVSKIAVKNNKHIAEDAILKDIPLKAGNPYNEVDISDSRRKILAMYNKNGFLDAKVVSDIEISNSSARITFDVGEGSITLFGKDIIIGNERTKSEVVQREFIHREGEAFDYGRLLKEKQRLYKIGLFSDVEVELSDKTDNKRDVLYKFKEANAGAVEFGLGYGEYEQLRGFLDISYRNLGGMHRQTSFRTELSNLEQRYILSYYEPWFISRDTAFKALLMHEERKERSIDTKEIRYRLRRNSASAGVERKISDSLKAELYYDLSLVETFDVKPDIVLSREDTGTLLISGVRPGLIYDTRDNPFEPKSGFVAGLSFKLASEALMSETDFAKALAYANAYQSLGKRVVLAVSLRGGLAKGFGNTRELPLVERFFLGGRTTVRGYEQDTLGPKGADGKTPTGGNAFAMGNVELRNDIGRGFGLVAFLDGGNVWQKSENADITNLKYTTGLGLRYNTPVGPFRIDYGHKLNRAAGESRSEIHFSIGHAF
jgi:outer membrane protein insertion porin family